MSISEASAESKLVHLIQELGYRASNGGSDNVIETAMSGFRVAIFITPKHSIQLFCGVALSEDSGFGLEEANNANKQLRFAKFYIDNEDDLGMESDFLFDVDTEDAASQLASIFSLWEGSLALMKERLADARAAVAAP
jgi:hypothetical protein